jgi:hypothetical protein
VASTELTASTMQASISVMPRWRRGVVFICAPGGERMHGL